MLEYTSEIVRGARYIAKALGTERIVIGIEANKPDCIAAFEPYADIEVVELRKRYPMGGEKQLIYSVTKRKVPAGKLPADAGCDVQNVATCLALCEAVADKIEADKGRHIAVIGATALGMILCQLLIYHQAVPVLIDSDPEKLKKANRAGIYYTLAADETLQSNLSQITGGRMAYGLSLIHI